MYSRWSRRGFHVKAALKQSIPSAEKVFEENLKSVWRKGAKSRRLGLAVSGGVDSMALASLCHRSPQSATFSLTAFIVDHKLRSNSGIEAQQVAAELAKLDIPSQILELDWKAHGDPATLTNFESVARTLRYQALGRACRDNDIGSLLVAHHADDQAETVMGRIIGNFTGVGLSGIRHRAPIPHCASIYGVDHSGEPHDNRISKIRSRENMKIENGGVTIVRPLLQLRKDQLITICNENGVRWFEDPTNTDVKLTTRNTIRALQRLNVLPLALRTDRLLLLAEEAERKRRNVEAAAQRLFNEIPIKLDLRSGAATFEVEKDFANATQLPSLTTLLRKMLAIVSPKKDIQLLSLIEAVHFVFDMNHEQIDTNIQPARKAITVAGVDISPTPRTRNSRPEANRFIFRRASPDWREKADQPTPLWDSSSPDCIVSGTSVSEWKLWDGRYWIRAYPSPTTQHQQPVVRFLDQRDIAFLRGHLSKKKADVLDHSLNVAAKGSFRFTLPVITVRQEGISDDAEPPKEKIMALPSLGVYFEDSQGYNGGSSKVWQWDIRYKHIELDQNGRHWVVA